MSQFFVDELENGGPVEVPIDHFYWMTDKGKKLYLVMGNDGVSLQAGRESFPCKSVPDGLRLLARAIEDTEKVEGK